MIDAGASFVIVDGQMKEQSGLEILCELMAATHTKETVLL